jgi:hypothetical protein
VELKSWSTRSSSARAILVRICETNICENEGSSRRSSLALLLRHLHRLAFRHRRRRRQPLGLSDQATLFDKLIRPQNSDNGFLSVFRQNGDFDPNLLDIEDGVGVVALCKKDLPLRIFGNVPTGSEPSPEIAPDRIQEEQPLCDGCFACPDVFVNGETSLPPQSAENLRNECRHERRCSSLMRRCAESNKNIAAAGPGHLQSITIP